MRLSRLSLPVLVVALFAACGDEPLSPDRPDGESAIQARRAAGAVAGDLEWRNLHVVSGLPSDLPERVAALGGEVTKELRPIDIAFVRGLDDAAAARLGRTDGVTWVVRDFAMQFLPDPIGLDAVEISGGAAVTGDPKDAFFYPIQWDMQIIDADDAWDAGYLGSSEVRVAILDSGIDPYHPDMAGLVDWDASIAFEPSISPVGPDWGDDRFHGTHVAGSVSTNGLGSSGVANGTTLIAVKICNWLGSCSFSGILDGLVYAADLGVDAVNMSLGGAVPEDVEGAAELLQAVQRAVNYANNRGALVISSAGNAGLRLTGSDGIVYTPCESGIGMCISATGPTDALASYSNFGRPAITMAAPGGDGVFGSSASDFVISPCSTLSVFLPTVAGFSCGPTSYIFAAGTSMAAPHVAGVAALLDAQAGGGLGPTTLRAILSATADDLGRRGIDAEFGYGRLNAFSAVTAP